MKDLTCDECANISEALFQLLVYDLKERDMFSGIWKSNNTDDFDLLFPVKLTLFDVRYQYRLATRILSSLDVESFSLALIKCEDAHYIAVKTWIEDIENS